jgi:peptidyl-lysine (3S)-dioxygenase / protease
MPLNDTLQQLNQDVADFEHRGHCVERFDVPDAFTFFREFATLNRPVVFRGAAAHWAARPWSLDNIAAAIGHQKVHVTVTPDGRADSVKAVRLHNEGCLTSNCTAAFVLPHTERMSFTEFVQLFRKTKRIELGAVPSIQFQNSNLAEFAFAAGSPMSALRLEDFAWAQEAFGTGDADAKNIWIGDARSSTTFHKVRSVSTGNC